MGVWRWQEANLKAGGKAYGYGGMALFRNSVAPIPPSEKYGTQQPKGFVQIDMIV